MDAFRVTGRPDGSRWPADGDDNDSRVQIGPDRPLPHSMSTYPSAEAHRLRRCRCNRRAGSDFPPPPIAPGGSMLPRSRAVSRDRFSLLMTLILVPGAM